MVKQDPGKYLEKKRIIGFRHRGPVYQTKSLRAQNNPHTVIPPEFSSDYDPRTR
jgi:hypothetical protein